MTLEKPWERPAGVPFLNSSNRSLSSSEGWKEPSGVPVCGVAASASARAFARLSSLGESMESLLRATTSRKASLADLSSRKSCVNPSTMPTNLSKVSPRPRAL